MSNTPHSGSEMAGRGKDPLLGTTLDGRYELQRQLGEGGMGRVYLAEDVRLRRQVAVKLMSAALSSQPEFRSRFQREALLQAQAAHPGIIQVLDTGECADGAYIVLEYSEGRSLRELLKRGPLRLPRVLDLVEQLLEVLEFAHRNGIIHRDLKPTNILIERDGSGRERVRVLDFGLAKLLVGDGGGGGQMTQQLTLTRPGSAFGTLEYMAPEQAAGEEVDHRADLYATGVILYELLSGKPPIRDRTPSGYLRKLFSEPVAPLHESHPHLNVPEEVGALVAWALEKEPSDRPNSALAFLETLRGYRNRSEARTSGEVPQTEPDRVAARPPQPTSRAASVMLFIGWLLAFAGAAGAGFLWYEGRNDRNALKTLREDTASAHEGLASAGFATGSLADGIEQLARRRAADVKEQEEKVLGLTQDLGKAQARIEQLTSERDRLQKEGDAVNATPRGGSDVEDPRLAGLEAAKTRLENTLREERARVLKLQEELRKARDEREKAETLAGTLEEEKGSLQKTVSDLQAKVASAPTAGGARELIQATTRVAQLQEELRQKDNDLRNARDEAGRLRNELASERQRSGNDAGRLQQLQSQLQAKEREVQDLRQKAANRRIKQPKLVLVNETGTTIRIDKIEASFIDDATFTFRTTELKPFPRLEIEAGERLAPQDAKKGWNGQCLMVTVEYKVWDKTTRRWEYRTPIEGSTTKGSNPGVFRIKRRR